MNLSEMKRLFVQRCLGSNGVTISKILLEATRLHNGWDMDNTIWLVELSDSSKIILSTNHGTLCVESYDELASAIEETQSSLNELTDIFEYLT